MYVFDQPTNKPTDRTTYQPDSQPTNKQTNIHKRESSPVKGLEWPRGFQEVTVPIFHDNGTGWW